MSSAMPLASSPVQYVPIENRVKRIITADAALASKIVIADDLKAESPDIKRKPAAIPKKRFMKPGNLPKKFQDKFDYSNLPIAKTKINETDNRTQVLGNFNSNEADPITSSAFSSGGSSTNESYAISIVRSNFAHMVSVARPIYFEEGSLNEVSRGIFRLMKFYPLETIELAREYIFSKSSNVEIASEVLKWLSVVNHIDTYDQRCNIVHEALFAKNPILRDAGIISLQSIYNSETLRVLRMAKSNENIPALRRDLDIIEAFVRGKVDAEVPSNS